MVRRTDAGRWRRPRCPRAATEGRGRRRGDGATQRSAAEARQPAASAAGENQANRSSEASSPSPRAASSSASSARAARSGSRRVRVTWRPCQVRGGTRASSAASWAAKLSVAHARPRQQPGANSSIIPRRSRWLAMKAGHAVQNARLGALGIDLHEVQREPASAASSDTCPPPPSVGLPPPAGGGRPVAVAEEQAGPSRLRHRPRWRGRPRWRRSLSSRLACSRRRFCASGLEGDHAACAPRAARTARCSSPRGRPRRPRSCPAAACATGPGSRPAPTAHGGAGTARSGDRRRTPSEHEGRRAGGAPATAAAARRPLPRCARSGRQHAVVLGHAGIDVDGEAEAAQRLAGPVVLDRYSSPCTPTRNTS